MMVGKAVESEPTKEMVVKAPLPKTHSQARRLKKMVKKKYMKKKIVKKAKELKVSKKITTEGEAQVERTEVVKTTPPGTKQEKVPKPNKQPVLREEQVGGSLPQFT